MDYKKKYLKYKMKYLNAKKLLGGAEYNEWALNDDGCPIKCPLAMPMPPSEPFKCVRGNFRDCDPCIKPLTEDERKRKLRANEKFTKDTWEECDPKEEATTTTPTTVSMSDTCPSHCAYLNTETGRCGDVTGRVPKICANQSTRSNDHIRGLKA